MRGIAENSILAHTSRGQCQTGPIANTAQNGCCTTALTLSKAAPNFWTSTVGPHVVHVDTVLGQERKDILARLNQLSGLTVLERSTKGSKPVSILIRFWEIDRTDQHRIRKRRLQLFCGGPQGEAGLIV